MVVIKKEMRKKSLAIRNIMARRDVAGLYIDPDPRAHSARGARVYKLQHPDWT